MTVDFQKQSHGEGTHRRKTIGMMEPQARCISYFSAEKKNLTKLSLGWKGLSGSQFENSVRRGGGHVAAGE